MEAPSQGTATPLYCFCIVGKCDTPLYERDLSPPGRRDDTPHLDEFIMHAALDVVDELAWQGTNLYLRQVDRFNDFSVSAYLTAGHVKLLLLHRTPQASTAATRALEDSIRDFFTEIHELYLKNLMNPFYEPNSLLSSLSFDEHIKSVAKKCLPSQ